MKISDLLNKNCIILDLKAKTKKEIILEMAETLKQDNLLNNYDGFVLDVLKREELTSTGIGDGLAIPHAKSSFVNKTSIVFARSRGGVDYQALDGNPVKLFFMLAVKDGDSVEHVDILAHLSKLFLNQDFSQSLLQTQSVDEVLTIINKFESADNSAKDSLPNISDDFIVAVTACPTGIAHTYMAAEALDLAAKKLNVKIKVETNGASGVGNILSSEDIKQAKGVILAINRNVETARFNNKQLIQVGAGEAIKQAEQLITDILNNKGNIYKENSSNTESTASTIGGGIYKHLMSGVSYMLPFVISGGILIALAFLIDKIGGVEAGSAFGSTTKLAQMFMTVGGSAFGFFVPILAAFIAFSIGNRAALASGFVGGGLALSGGSGFLGAIVAGFLAGYITLWLIKVCSKLPKSLDGIKSILIYPVLSVLIVGLLMVVLFNTPMKFINEGILNWLNTLGGTNRILLGLLLGGMMAVDMGGPVNKAAYVFGVASLSSGSSEVMAAVMAGGMTPPLGIALATTFIKNKFSKEEREAGKSNYVMGLSFITEGAIPFAASDPLRIIPCFVVGSSIAGALTMMFHISLPAPHGGIVVMFLSSNPWLYILAVLVGAVITAGLVGILKRTPEKS
ncbi:MAG: fructose-specific PTS transporter subunit EIIC [Alphaproteobacteria bacterium]|jgi:PTS system fructose-specific IIC component|nr:fructose-specific PTS transporter subunit EIIC [Alphaproteobacteria bacterium]